MGCSDSVQSKKPKHISPQKLNKGPMTLDIELKWLRNALEVKKMKLEASLARNVFELEKTFKQPSRNKVIQRQKIQQCTFIKNEVYSKICFLSIVYGAIINYLKILEQYKELLKDPQHILELKPPFVNILYAKEAISNDDLESFCGKILKKYPEFQKQSKEQEKEKILIKDEVIEHHRNQRLPNSKMINQFAMELCKQEEGIDLSLINASGNNFCYE